MLSLVCLVLEARVSGGALRILPEAAGGKGLPGMWNARQMELSERRMIRQKCAPDVLT